MSSMPCVTDTVEYRRVTEAEPEQRRRYDDEACDDIALHRAAWCVEYLREQLAKIPPAKSRTGQEPDNLDQLLHLMLTDSAGWLEALAAARKRIQTAPELETLS